MEQKIIKVYYDENGLPFQDLALTKPCSIVGSDFTGANNATEVHFYVANIDDTYTWVANIKLQDGTMAYRLLTSATDEESDPYKLLVLDNGITAKKGFIYVGLNGYGGETLIEEVEGVLTINGNPIIVATGTISIALNYNPVVIPLGTSIEPTEMQQILANLSQKLEQDDLDTALDDLPNKAQYDLDRNEKVDKTTTILGIPLDNNVLLGEFKTALGEAITGVSGLMSAQDKARLDALHDLLEEDASHRFVTDTEKNTWNAKQNALGFTAENVANKKTTLSDSDVDYPTSKAVKTAIETAVSQTLKPMGNWNANTNTPTLTDSNINKANEMYYVNVAGTQFGIKFDVGDELVYNTNGVIFRRDNVDSVVSVNTKQGVVVLNQDDIGDGATYKQVSQAEKNTWDGKQDKLVAGDNITIDENTNVISASGGGDVSIWRYE